MFQRPKLLRPSGKIYQAINADTLRAQNIETWPYFNQVVYLMFSIFWSGKCTVDILSLYVC
jgi:hypothetical protein